MSESPKVSFVSCWLQSTAIVYVIFAILGFLSGGAEGLGFQLGAGIIRAPLLGLVVGGIWWAAKR